MAHWIDNADSWICSDCGFESGRIKPECPKCGAKMDGIAEKPKKKDLNDSAREEMAKRIKSAGQWLIDNAESIASKPDWCTKCYVSFEVMEGTDIPTIDVDYSFIDPRSINPTGGKE